MKRFLILFAVFMYSGTCLAQNLTRVRTYDARALEGMSCEEGCLNAPSSFYAHKCTHAWSWNADKDADIVNCHSKKGFWKLCRCAALQDVSAVVVHDFGGDTTTLKE